MTAELDDYWNALMADEPQDEQVGPFEQPAEPQPELITGLDEKTALDEVDRVFAHWLGDGYDLGSLYAVLAIAAVDRLNGDPPWLLLVSGSGNTKTETVTALAGAGAHIASTITSEGALLSATANKERTSDATGGLLRKIGDHGILVLKDVTSVLSMNRDARNSVLGALREVADGYWQRNVGSDGGKALTWKGRIVVVGAVTTAWDTHHSVIASMGDRFLLYRSDSAAGLGRQQSGRRSLANIGSETQMRAELAEAVRALMAGIAIQPSALTEAEVDELLGMADVVSLARTAVERDQRGDVIDAHAPEAPTRLVKYLGQLFRGALAIGLTRTEAMTLCRRVAHDCMPPLRLLTLKHVVEKPWSTTTALAKAAQRPRQSIDRTLQELVALGIVEIDEQPNARGWIYAINSERVNPPDLETLIDGSKPITRKVTTSTQGHKEGVSPSTDISGEAFTTGRSS